MRDFNQAKVASGHSRPIPLVLSAGWCPPGCKCDLRHRAFPAWTTVVCSRHLLARGVLDRLLLCERREVPGATW